MVRVFEKRTLPSGKVLVTLVYEGPCPDMGTIQTRPFGPRYHPDGRVLHEELEVPLVGRTCQFVF